MEHASTAVENGGQLGAVYCDISKAFDVVSHPLLLKKLFNFDIPYPLLALLHDYLTGRHCSVQCNGRHSGMYSATSGVPQGSVLRPLLFSLFINGVSTAQSSIHRSCFAQTILNYSKNFQALRRRTAAT